MVFEWKNLPGHTTLQLLEEIQTMMADKNCALDPFKRSDHLHVAVQRHRLDGKTIQLHSRKILEPFQILQKSFG